MRHWGALGGAFAVAVAAVAVMSGPAGAATQAIGVSPTSQEIDLMPGGMSTGELTIINDGSTDITYRLYASNYSVKDETYGGDFTSTGAGNENSAVTWVKLPAGKFVVKAREEVKQPYTLMVPKNASVGGHYAAIFVETIPPPASGAAIVSRIDRVASILYLAVGGDLVRTGTVEPLKAKWLQHTSPVTGDLRVQNTGNVHFLVEGTAHLTPLFGTSTRDVAFRGEVLPSTTRKFALALPASSPIGLYKMEVNATFLGNQHTLSAWVLLMPVVTMWVVGGTVLLMVAVAAVWLVRRVRRRGNGSSRTG